MPGLFSEELKILFGLNTNDGDACLLSICLLLKLDHTDEGREREKEKEKEILRKSKREK